VPAVPPKIPVRKECTDQKSPENADGPLIHVTQSEEQAADADNSGRSGGGDAEFAQQLYPEVEFLEIPDYQARDQNEEYDMR
jgi:hypothetical protein